jgi:hypothetical protein
MKLIGHKNGFLLLQVRERTSASSPSGAILRARSPSPTVGHHILQSNRRGDPCGRPCKGAFFNIVPKSLAHARANAIN